MSLSNTSNCSRGSQTHPGSPTAQSPAATNRKGPSQRGHQDDGWHGPRVAPRDLSTRGLGNRGPWPLYQLSPELHECKGPVGQTRDPSDRDDARSSCLGDTLRDESCSPACQPGSELPCFLGYLGSNAHHLIATSNSDPLRS